MSNRNADETCRNWDEHFPIGTEVTWMGKAYKTASHAGRNYMGEASVFLEDGQSPPVPIASLEVAGWDMVPKHMAKKRGKR